MNERQVLLSGRIPAVPNRFSAIRNTLPPSVNSFLPSADFKLGRVGATALCQNCRVLGARLRLTECVRRSHFERSCPN